MNEIAIFILSSIIMQSSRSSRITEARPTERDMIPNTAKRIGENILLILSKTQCILHTRMHTHTHIYTTVKEEKKEDSVFSTRPVPERESAHMNVVSRIYVAFIDYWQQRHWHSCHCHCQCLVLGQTMHEQCNKLCAPRPIYQSAVLRDAVGCHSARAHFRHSYRRE